jgi:hypothetical protein
MLGNPTIHRILWAVAGLLTLVAATTGIALPNIYAAVVSPGLLPGAYAQDLISAVAGLGLLVLAAAAPRPKRQLVALGLVGYLFYAYGIYVIERTYNGLYLVYLAIFALAFWGMVAGGAGLRRAVMVRAALPRRLQILSASGALLQPLIFYPLWIAMLLPLIAVGNQIDSLYSIFILDLAFVMPAFLILALLAFRRQPAGLVLLPAMYVLGFTLIFSLALAELVKPLFDAGPNGFSFWTSAALSLLFLVLGWLHLRRLSFDGSRDSRDSIGRGAAADPADKESLP